MADQRILFSKSGSASYSSHLDLMHTMERAFLRAGIFIRHTEGFHPHPYVSIPLPLPLFFSSACEILEFGLVSGATTQTLPEKMNKVLPKGIEIKTCYDGGLPFRKLSFVRYQITLEFETPLASQAETAFRTLFSQESFVVKKRSKKAKSGFTEVDIIPLVEEVESIQAEEHTKLHRRLTIFQKKVESIQAEEHTLTLTLLLKAQNPGLNPDVLLQGFRTEYPQFPILYSACHRCEILDDQKNIYR